VSSPQPSVLTVDSRLPPRALYTVDEVAAHLHVHRKTVLRSIADGRLPAAKIGKSYRVRSADLAAFTGAGQSPSPPAHRPARVTCVVDIPDVDDRRAVDIASTMSAALRGRDGGDGQMHVEVVHDSERAHVTIVVVGPIADTGALLAIVEMLVSRND